MDSTRCHQSERDSEPSQHDVLVAILEARDPVAWEKLEHYLGPVVLTWARNLRLRHQDAEDVTEEVLLVVHEHVAASNEEIPDGNLYAWARTVTETNVADFFRKHGAEPAGRGGDWAQALAQVPQRYPADDDAGGCRDGNERALQIEAVARARDRMEHRTWLAAERRLGDEQPAAAVAEELGISLDAVYHATSRVRALARGEREALGH